MELIRIDKYLSGLGDRQFQELKDLIIINNHKIKQIMEAVNSSFEDLSSKLDSQAQAITEIGGSLDGIDTDLASLTKTINDLKAAAGGNGVVINQDQLNALAAKADAVSAGLAGLRTKAAAVDAENPASTTGGDSGSGTGTGTGGSGTTGDGSTGAGSGTTDGGTGAGAADPGTGNGTTDGAAAAGAGSNG